MKLWFAMLLVLAAPAFAGDRVIELADGSRLTGEIVSMENGSYTIRTRALGTIRVSESQVISITSSPDMPVPGGSGAALQGAAVEQVQARIASDPGLMSRIIQLQHDPQMQSVLADPEIMRAVQSLDLEALARNPKIQALMNNPVIREIQSGTR